MYARLVYFTMGPGTRSTAETIRKQFSQALMNSEGLIKVYFMNDDETGLYCTLVLWESKEAGEKTFANLEPKLKQALDGLVQEPPQSFFLEVVEVVEP